MPHPEVPPQGLAAAPTFETDDMVLMHGSPDRNRRGQRRHGRRRCHAEAAERAVNGCNEVPELIGSDLVLRDITANDSDHEAAIYLLRVGHFSNQAFD